MLSGIVSVCWVYIESDTCMVRCGSSCKCICHCTLTQFGGHVHVCSLDIHIHTNKSRHSHWMSGLFQGIHILIMHHKSMLTLMDQEICPRVEGDVRGDVCTSSKWIFY